MMRKASLYFNPRQSSFFPGKSNTIAPRPDTSTVVDEKVAGILNSSTAFEVDQDTRVSGPQYLNHSEIKRRAIQIFHTDYVERNGDRPARGKPFFYHTIHPNDQFRRTFDFFTVIWVLALVVVIPFEIGFDWYETSKVQKVLFDLLDVWFAVDILLNFRTGYIHHGTIVMKPEKIVSNYLTTWFVIDLLGAFPFEKIVRADASSRKSLKLVKYFKIPKLLRISRVMKYVRDHKKVYDLVQVFFLVFTLLHIGACAWMLVLDPCGIYDDDSYAGTEVCSQGNVYNLYVEAFHLCAAMMLGISNFHIIGSPGTLDTLIERRESDRVRIYIVSTLYMVGGLFIVALLMSEMNAYLMGKTQASAAFQRRSDRVKHEMVYYGVPDDLQVQVKAFYDYVWIHQRQYDDKIALLSDQQMSTDLQRKLALHLFKDVVSHISFFSEVDDLLLGEICLSLRTRIFLPNDMILFKGDVGKELFIISKGVVEVLRDDLPPNKRHRSPPILLRNGSFFGEIALVMEVRRTCSVQARTICEVNILGQQAFDAILRENPDFARRMNELVVARQLETSLAKSVQKGVDFKVAKEDLERAVDAVERNMKEGLERRRGKDVTIFAPSPMQRIDEVNGVFQQPMGSSTVHAAPPHATTVHTTGSVPVDVSAATVSEVPHLIQMNGKEEDETVQCVQPSTRLSTTTVSTAASDVTEIFDDIARRSTRFVLKPKDRPIHEQEESSDNDVTVCADAFRETSEIKASQQHEGRKTWWRKRQRNGGDESIRFPCRTSKLGEDPETMRVTGHFSPGRSVVDIGCVRPSILNTRAAAPRDDRIERLDAQLSSQNDMMRQLMKKIDMLERERSSRQDKGASAGACLYLCT